MNRRHSFETMLGVVGVAALFIVLLISRNWPTAQWAVLAIAAIVLAAVLANVLYAFVSLELGYYAEDEKARRARKQFGHGPHRLRHLLHPGMLRHR